MPTVLVQGRIAAPKADLMRRHAPKGWQVTVWNPETDRVADFESLAIERDDGRRTGGRSFFGLSLEARVGVRENIEVVTFYDFGYIGAESFPDFTGESHAGAGIGVRYKTGIGPIRLDLATPVSGDTDGSSLYIYVGIGQAF